MPSLKWPLIWMAVSIYVFIGGTIQIITGNFSSIPMLPLVAIFFFCQLSSYHKTIEKRKQYRQKKLETWLLRRELPPLDEQTDWAEIERAMDALLRENVEPTYERAVDWLRTEKAKAEYMKKWYERGEEKKANPFRKHEHRDVEPEPAGHVEYCNASLGGVCNYRSVCIAHYGEKQMKPKRPNLHEHSLRRELDVATGAVHYVCYCGYFETFYENSKTAGTARTTES